MVSSRTATLILSVFLGFSQPADAQRWMPKVTVDESPVDWLVPDSRNEESKSPVRSKKSRCEIFVPPQYNPDRSSPLLLYLSPGPRPQAARRWKFVLNHGGIIYAAPLGVGNTVPVKDRIQTTLDVLHHMRKHYNVDPDRTYLVGFSGGGRVAIKIAFSFPAYFGGVVPVCSGGELPREAWLQDRVTERLRVALITGTSDFNRAEVIARTLTTLRESGVATRSWVPKMGHTLPSGEVLAESLMWLEEGLPQRQRLVTEFPATRVADHPTQKEWSQRLLDEAHLRIAEPKSMRSGAVLLKGIAERWPQTTVGADALAKFEQLNSGLQDQDWKEEQLALGRVRLVAKAKGMQAYATADLPKVYEVQRSQMLRSAISLWQAVAASSANETDRADAEARLEALRAQQ